MIRFEEYFVSETLSFYLNFVKLLAIIFFIAHWSACLWYLTGARTLNDPKSWVTKSELSNASTKEKYVTSLYWAFTTMTTVGYGDYYPVSDEGRWFACIVCSLGFFYVAILCLAFQHELEMTNAE